MVAKKKDKAPKKAKAVKAAPVKKVVEAAPVVKEAVAELKGADKGRYGLNSRACPWRRSR